VVRHGLTQLLHQQVEQDSSPYYPIILLMLHQGYGSQALFTCFPAQMKLLSGRRNHGSRMRERLTAIVALHELSQPNDIMIRTALRAGASKNHAHCVSEPCIFHRWP
jgi:hypothetical protein